jgi:hypothetical protein
MDQIFETPGGGAKEMQQTIVSLDVKAPKAAKRGDAEHLGGAEKAQDDHDKEDPSAMARKNATERAEGIVNIGEHIDLLVGLDNPVDDLRQNFSVFHFQ